MLTQAVGQEFGWSSVGTAFLCCTVRGSAERFEGWVLHIGREAGNIWGHPHGSGGWWWLSAEPQPGCWLEHRRLWPLGRLSVEAHLGFFTAWQLGSKTGFPREPGKCVTLLWLGSGFTQCHFCRTLVEAATKVPLSSRGGDIAAIFGK